MWPFKRQQSRLSTPTVPLNLIPVTFHELLSRYGVIPGSQFVLTEEEQSAVDTAWSEFVAAATKDGPPGQRFYVPPEVHSAMQESIASSALHSLAVELIGASTPSSIRVPDPTARQRACSAAAKSLVFNTTPLSFYNVGTIFEWAEEKALAGCLYREFLHRREKNAGRVTREQLQAEQAAVQRATEFLRDSGAV
jgi:hypothetical protein